MGATSTITFRVTPELKGKLDLLAQKTGCKRSSLAVKALEVYVNYETPIVEGIHRGLVDMAAGKVIPHEEAMARVDQIISDARKQKLKSG
ncbi:MAG: hypothetical protein B7Y36_12030 [Novosphingobium sp. 28-62-57]|nr:MAG: hypothetical protein B7Z34_02805 [Novosphingobium sp. 12-62-10]OYZ10116.1 MAG: hypothetical protein B7Y36_12030 [Novosphingobium sp. 28-62-57]OZA35925.1 MAG: hypothetical protein B7X92_08435 [Novosphingobium sp. 17-62-9]